MDNDEEEVVSRRDLFTGWARGLRDGLAEWVLPEIEREAQRLREAFVAPEFGGSDDVETEHPWRQLLEPQEPEEPQAPQEPEGSEGPAEAE